MLCRNGVSGLVGFRETVTSVGQNVQSRIVRILLEFGGKILGAISVLLTFY